MQCKQHPELPQATGAFHEFAITFMLLDIERDGAGMDRKHPAHG